MCGIAGFYHSKLPAQEHPSIIKAMLHLIRHRGPDENGSYVHERATLGNARLSIIDLASGQQPMCDATKRYWICYTGEIYNYKSLQQQLKSAGHSFKTNSDTEVVLYAWIQWGPAALSKFNGSFAFAIYDQAEDKLSLVRDHYGKRPLYYYHRGDELVFSSEIKGFLAYPTISFAFDANKVETTFASWTSLPNETIFQNIHQLPMGSYLTIQQDRLTCVEYVTLDFTELIFRR